MRAIEATIQAMNEIELRGEGDALAEIYEMAERVRVVVPDCLGLSLSSTATGVTLTLVATDDEIAALDALQYISGGPCVDTAEVGRGVDVEVADALDEKGWQLYARGAAAEGVASSLTLPILSDKQVTGTVNLYASGADSFLDHEEELARILGAWAGGAVSNADLAFGTRKLAERAPEVLQDQLDVDVAIGTLSMTDDRGPDDRRGPSPPAPSSASRWPGRGGTRQDRHRPAARRALKADAQ